MALEYAHGAIQWSSADGVGTTYTVSGLSFQPKALRFTCQGLGSASDAVSQTTDLRASGGFAVSPSLRRCIAIFDDDAAILMDCGAGLRNDAVVATIDGSGAFDGRLDLNVINSDGFQLIVDDQGVANLTVFWEAWGGSDITVADIVDIAEPSATGTQSYTVTGFASDGAGQVLMFFGCQSTAAANTGAATDAGMCVGFASGTAGANQVVGSINQDDASADADTDTYTRDGECLAMIVLGGGNPNARAVLNAWQTDAFQLNWTARATTNRRYIALAIKGGQWVVGSTTLDVTGVNNTVTVSSLPFQPIGLSLISSMVTEHSAGSSGTEGRLSVGMGTSTTSRRAMGVWDENGTSACQVDLQLEYDAVLCMPTASGTTGDAIDIDAINTDGFRLIVDAIDGPGTATTWIGYLVFASGGGIMGSGALVADAVEMAGAGVSATEGTGALTAQVAQATGQGIGESTGTGVLVAQATLVDGDGASASVGTGALQAQAATVAGSGTVTGVVGSGVLVASAAILDGAGIGQSSGVGVLTVDTAVIDAIGLSLSSGVGAFTTQIAILDGIGIVSWVAMGALIADAAVVDGSGVVAGGPVVEDYIEFSRRRRR